MLRLKRVILFTGSIFIYLLSASPSFGQGEPDPDPGDARDIFWSAKDLIGQPVPDRLRYHLHPRPASTHSSTPGPIDHSTVVNAPIGLRYSVLKERQDKTYEEVSPQTEFRAGDRIQMSVISNREGYLYVIEQGSSGAWIPLYPQAGDEGANRLVPGKEYLVPSGGSWTFDSQRGEEKVFVLLTSAPESNLGQTIASLKSPEGRTLTASNSIGDDIVQTLREREKVGVRDLVFTKSGEAASSSSSHDKQDKGDYVINKTPKGANPHVMVDVVLVHH